MSTTRPVRKGTSAAEAAQRNEQQGSNGARSASRAAHRSTAASWHHLAVAGAAKPLPREQLLDRGEPLVQRLGRMPCAQRRRHARRPPRATPPCSTRSREAGVGRIWTCARTGSTRMSSAVRARRGEQLARSRNMRLRVLPHLDVAPRATQEEPRPRRHPRSPRARTPRRRRGSPSTCHSDGACASPSPAARRSHSTVTSAASESAERKRLPRQLGIGVGAADDRGGDATPVRLRCRRCAASTRQRFGGIERHRCSRSRRGARRRHSARAMYTAPRQRILIVRRAFAKAERSRRARAPLHPVERVELELAVADRRAPRPATRSRERAARAAVPRARAGRRGASLRRRRGRPRRPGQRPQRDAAERVARRSGEQQPPARRRVGAGQRGQLLRRSPGSTDRR